MKNFLATLIFLGLLLPLVARAQFTFTTNNGAITITGYNTNAGLNVVIPASTNGYPVTAIAQNAFIGKTTITNVIIPNSVTNIGTYAFESCSGLKSVMIPNSVTTLGYYVFSDCSGLTSVTIGNSVTYIGISVFQRCSGLTSVTIGNNVTEIGSYAFQSCSGLTSVTIPNSVRSIDTQAFQSCSGLTNVTIPNSVTSLGSAAFYNCSGLTSVTIPNSVTNISSFAFKYCSSLTNVYFQGNAPLVNGTAGSSDTSVFSGESGKAYYLPGMTGWSSTFGGWPTALPYQPQPQILAAGLGNNQFGFITFWATNASVVVLASTNLLTWTPISTNVLVGGTNAFADSTWTNYPCRFYRVQAR